jgi:hypothetical protein
MKWAPYVCGALLMLLGAVKIIDPFVPTSDYPRWYGPMLQTFACVECALGCGVLWRRSRRVCSAATAALGVALVLSSAFAATFNFGLPSCGCLGRYRLDNSVRLSLAGALAVLGGLSLVSVASPAETPKERGDVA